MKSIIKTNLASLNSKKRLAFLLKDSAIYGGAAAISQAFALITFPLLARHLTVEQYGVLDYFLVLGTLLGTFFIFGQDSAVARYFYEYEDNYDRQKLISESIVFQLGGLAVFLPIFFLVSDWLTGFMIDTTERAQLFKIVLLQLPFILIINFTRNLLKWTFDRSHFLIMSLGFTLVQASLLVVAVLVFEVGVKEVLVVNLVACIIFGLLGLFFVRKWLTCPKEFSHIREMLSYAIPLGFICVAAAFSPPLERSITDSLLGAESLGLYAVGTKIAMLMGLLVSAFQTAWGPFSLSLYKQTDAGHTYNWVFKLFALLACLATLTLTLLAQPLISILATDRYHGAVVVVFPLAMGAAVMSTSWITEIGIGIAKRSYLNLYSYAVAILITVVGISLLTPILGLFGVGLGVLFGHIARSLTASWLAQRVYPLPWQYLPVLFIMTLTMVSGMVSIWIGKLFGLLVGNLLLGGTICLILVLGWLVLFSQADRIQVKELISQLWITRIKKQSKE